MPDITMCTNSDCPIRSACYRYRAIPDDWQSFAKFEPEPRTGSPVMVITCFEFWECRDYPANRLVPTEEVDLKLKGAEYGRQSN